MTPEEERRQQIERDRLALVDPETTGQLLRLADTIHEAGKEFSKDQAQFQRDISPVFLTAMDNIPKGASFPANGGRLPDARLNALEDYGHGRGFLKVNPNPPNNLYEDMKNVEKEGAGPGERLVLSDSERRTVRAEVLKQEERDRREREQERERSLNEDDDRW